MSSPAPPVFLTAEWRHLVMASYAVAPGVLAELAPPGTELDFREGETFVTLVGFLFLNTRLLGGRVRVPCHADFPEINLRFYVRRRGPDGDWRRGTVFIKEVVPLPAVAAVARLCYGEKYLARPVRWHLTGGDASRGPDALEFRWRSGGAWNRFRLAADASASWQPSAPGSMEEWISEHYFGYSSRRRGRETTEYAVEHPRWRVRPGAGFDAQLPGAEELYGAAFAEVLRGAPANAFVAEGSPVLIRRGLGVPG